VNDFLAFAHQLADVAGDIIRPYFGAHGEVESKSDTSPVTIADREAEAAIRRLIQERYPEHGIYGEEFGQEVLSRESLVVSNKASSHSVAPSHLAGEGWDGGAINETQTSPPLTQPSPARGEVSPAAPLADTTHHSPLTTHDYTWVIDPIDGTRAFIAGRKEWGTLIALCENGVPILGILDQPVTGERWVGVRGQATTYSAVPAQEVDPRRRAKEITVTTRACASLAEAEFSTTSANYFTPVQAAKVVKLAQACRATVRDGDCYAYGLLARGLRDVVVDAGLKPYDILALVPIIEGAGGKIAGWDGAPVTLTHYRDVVAVGNVATQQEALAFLHKPD
jgi:myo-inositol-1(or 4)-monophosphatase